MKERQEKCGIPVLFRRNESSISGICPNYPGARQLIKELGKKRGGQFNMYESKGKIYFSFKFTDEDVNPERRDI